MELVLYGSAYLTDINFPLFQQHAKSCEPINTTGIGLHELKHSTVNLSTIIG